MGIKKSKTLIIIGALHAGGAETWAVNHAALQKKGSVEILAFSSKNQILYPNCPIHILPRNSLSHYLKFIRLLKNRDIDNIHCNTNYSAIFYTIMSFFLGVKSIVHWHNDTRNIEVSCGFLKKQYYFMSRLLILFFSRKILCVSERAKSAFVHNNFLAKIMSKKINVVYCGTRLFVSEESKVINKRVKKICHFGRFVEQKNHKRLIDIFSALLKKDSDFSIDFYGEGDLKPEIEIYAKNVLGKYSHKLNFFNPVTNVKQLMYSEYDLLLMPSLNEGLPIVLMEAFSTGLPCLVSDQISREVELFPNVSVMSLEFSDEIWANKITELYTLNVNQDAIMHKFVTSPFNLECSSEKIKQEY